jgi:signal recognition particle receptor subunit beta
MWDDLVRGALGAVVLADTRRLADSFPALDYFEGSGLPFVVAVNRFEGAPVYSPESVRDSLAVPDHVPVLLCDAREQASVVEVLTALVLHALAEEPVPAAVWPGPAARPGRVAGPGQVPPS